MAPHEVEIDEEQSGRSDRMVCSMVFCAFAASYCAVAAVALAGAAAMLFLTILVALSAADEAFGFPRPPLAWGFGPNLMREREPQPQPQPTTPCDLRGTGKLGSYNLEEVLHHRHGVEVWKAVDARDGAIVALKLETIGAAQNTSASAEIGRARLQRESNALHAVDSPYVTAFHDGGSSGGRVFVASRLAGGGSLAGRLVSAPNGLAATDAVGIVEQVAAGLDDLHAAGWVHRDVKASNVVFDSGARRWMLCDLGIAQRVAEAEDDRLTDPAVVVCSPTHVAPELLAPRGNASAASPASDVYALAVLTFQLLTGRLPVDPAASSEELVGIHLAGALPPLSAHRPDLEVYDPVLTRALATDPAERYPTPSTFAAALAAAGSPVAVPTRLVSNEQSTATARSTRSVGTSTRPRRTLARSRASRLVLGGFAAAAVLLPVVLLALPPGNSTPSSTAAGAPHAATTTPTLMTRPALMNRPGLMIGSTPTSSEAFPGVGESTRPQPAQPVENATPADSAGAAAPPSTPHAPRPFIFPPVHAAPPDPVTQPIRSTRVPLHHPTGHTAPSQPPRTCRAHHHPGTRPRHHPAAPAAHQDTPPHREQNR